MTGIAHPIKTIWLRPRSTIRHIVANDPEYGVFVLTVLAGALFAPFEVSTRLGEQGIPLAFIFVLAAVAGAVKGFFALYLGGWLLTLTGRWLGGSASSAEVRAAIAWSNAPVVVGCIVCWILVALESAWEFGGAFTLFTAAVLLAVFVWSYAMLAACHAAVQHFSLWKSALLLAGLWACLGALMWTAAWVGVSGFTSALDSSFLGMSGAP